MVWLLVIDVLFLLMDECFVVLDGFVCECLQDEIWYLVFEGSGCGILFVIYFIDEVLLLGDEVLVLVNGSVLLQDLYVLIECCSDFVMFVVDCVVILDWMWMY